MLRDSYLGRMSDDEFFNFCQSNRKWRIERKAKHDILVRQKASSASYRARPCRRGCGWIYKICGNTFFVSMIPYQQQFLAQLDFEPPKEYLAYLVATESIYQFGSAYLIEDDELLSFNADYEAAEFYPGYFLIGSDGGGEAFAIAKATGNFVQTPFIGHDAETPAVVGRTWPEFLEYLRTDYA
jgi:hypothetical protein